MTSIDSIPQLYGTYFLDYPYACSAVAYYIFGDSDEYNLLRKAFELL